MNEDFKKLRILINNYAATLDGLKTPHHNRKSTTVYGVEVQEAKKVLLSNSKAICDGLKFSSDMQNKTEEIYKTVEKLSEEIAQINLKVKVNRTLIPVMEFDAFKKLNRLFEGLNNSSKS